MTHDWHPTDKSGNIGKDHEMEETLEQRLRFYYGSELPEQPLPESSWQQVFSQLAAQRRHPLQRRRRHRWQPFIQYVRGLHYSLLLPSDVRIAFTHVLFDARMPHAEYTLACRTSARAQVPEMRVSLLRRHPLRLTLPAHVAYKPAELDVVLASGLARHEEMRRTPSLLLSLLSKGILASLLVWAMAALLVQGVSLFARCLSVLACMVLIGAVLWLFHKYTRRLLRRADSVMVRWIGRARACQGLHALADHSHIPSQRKWGELSLTERIANVCGTQVAMQEEDFTLVR